MKIYLFIHVEIIQIQLYLSPIYRPTQNRYMIKNNTSKLLLIAIIVCIINKSSAIEFKLNLTSQQRFCFYEVFEAQQKYTYSSTSILGSKQEVQISHIDGRIWKSIFMRATLANQFSIRADKLASASTTYSFCVRNLQDQQRTFEILFISGLDVMQLHALPDETDGQNLQRQLNWLQKQTTTLGQKAQSIEGLRRLNFQINGMVGTKMIFFAIIGLVAIGAVNFVFYKTLKTQLRKRKLI